MSSMDSNEIYMRGRARVEVCVCLCLFLHQQREYCIMLIELSQSGAPPGRPAHTDQFDYIPPIEDKEK